jgi:glucokinase
MADFPYPVLVSDVGGTNARFACIATEGGQVSPIIRLSTEKFPDFSTAARAAIAQGGFPRPRSLLVGAAGPLTGRTATLTNANWTIDGPATAAALELQQGILLNDFETLSLCLPTLGAADLEPVGAVRAATPGGARLVVGPGTGLGVGALLNAGGRYLPAPSEGGHAGMGAESLEELTLLGLFGAREQRVQAEMLLAGPALRAMFGAQAQMAGQTRADADPAAILASALRGDDPVACAAVLRQIDLIARFCGDMALTFLATGGVYLAGGMLPRFRPLIDPVAFRATFERNARMQALLTRIPVWLITAEEPALLGLAALARTPQRYLLDYEARLWG